MLTTSRSCQSHLHNHSCIPPRCVIEKHPAVRQGLSQKPKPPFWLHEGKVAAPEAEVALLLSMPRGESPARSLMEDTPFVVSSRVSALSSHLGRANSLVGIGVEGARL